MDKLGDLKVHVYLVSRDLVNLFDNENVPDSVAIGHDWNAPAKYIIYGQGCL